MSEPSVADLLDTLRALSARVAALEEELSAVKAVIPPREVPPEVVVAISGAVAAFLGHRARLKQVHYRSGAAWTQQGRIAVQRRNVTHGVR